MPRLQLLFPPGLDGIPLGSEFSGLGKPNAYSTTAMSTILLSDYNPLAACESVIVKSAWYGKQTELSRHEFILVQIGSEGRRELHCPKRPDTNYLILDRNVHRPPKPGRFKRLRRSNKSLEYSQISLQGGLASDTFKVSYDGDLEKLLIDCELNPCQLIEQLQFPSDKPLPFHELVTLASLVSRQYPEYDTLDLSCYFFAGIIWEVLCKLRPNPTITKAGALDKEKGKNGWYRFTVPRLQVEEIYKLALGMISETKSDIDAKKQELDEFVQKRLEDFVQGGTTEAGMTAMSVSVQK